MKRVIAVLALPLCLLGFAPARVAPAPDPLAAPAPAVRSPGHAFSEPRCLGTVGDPKLRLKCYRAVLQAHLHHWSEEDVGVDRSILDWHAQKAWDIYVESASYVAAKEGSYSRTQISQYMYLASLVIMTDVYAEHYATDPRVKRICVAADAALKLAWQKTYCASGTDEPAASAVPGSSREDATLRYRAACGKDPPDRGVAPVNCKGVVEERAAVSALANVLLDKEREVRQLAALAPDGGFEPPTELATWKTELVKLSTDLEQQVATGTFDPQRHSEQIKTYRAQTELPGVVAVEAAKAETVEELYGALGAKPPPNVTKVKTLTQKPPSPRELCGADATTCKKFEGALEGFYGKLDQHDLEADTAKEANAIVNRRRQAPKSPRLPARPR